MTPAGPGRASTSPAARAEIGRRRRRRARREPRTAQSVAWRPAKRCGGRVRRLQVQRDRVAPDEGDEADRRGQPRRLVELAVEAHRRRAVEDDAHGDVVLGLEQPDEQVPGAGVERVVDAAVVVARVVLAVVGEVERADPKCGERCSPAKRPARRRRVRSCSRSSCASSVGRAAARRRGHRHRQRAARTPALGDGDGVEQPRRRASSAVTPSAIGLVADDEPVAQRRRRRGADVVDGHVRAGRRAGPAPCPPAPAPGRRGARRRSGRSVRSRAGPSVTTGWVATTRSTAWRRTWLAIGTWRVRSIIATSVVASATWRGWSAAVAGRALEHRRRARRPTGTAPAP